LWVDLDNIPGGANYGAEIVRAIRASRAIIVMCSRAAMRSRNVKQEIQIAWRCGRPYLPLLLEEDAMIQDQLAYWLEGWQWIKVFESPASEWIPRVADSLAALDKAPSPGESSEHGTENAAKATTSADVIDRLWATARFTSCIWPVSADHFKQASLHTSARGLGGYQPDALRSFRLGSRICLAIESDTAGHLLLLDKGPEGLMYCLCPSHFSPETQISPGLFYVPRGSAEHDAFVVSGRPGREHLLAVITKNPLELDWMSRNPKTPARILETRDLQDLVRLLKGLDSGQWTALSTYFNVVG
jgi:hypothetical protein